MKGDTCSFEGKTYDSGVQLCDSRSCWVCRDGEWEEKGAMDFIMGGP